MITRMCEAETVTNHADVSRSDGEELDHADVGYARGDEARSPVILCLGDCPGRACSATEASDAASAVIRPLWQRPHRAAVRRPEVGLWLIRSGSSARPWLRFPPLSASYMALGASSRCHIGKIGHDPHPVCGEGKSQRIKAEYISKLSAKY